MADLTPSQTIGPFYYEALRWGIEATSRPGGENARVEGRVLDANGAPVDDALLEIWQPAFESDAGTLPGLQRVSTDDAGRFAFRMPVRPGSHYANVTVFARGLLNGLFTRVYLEGATGLPEAVPEARRDTLVARRQPGEAPVYTWTLRLRGEGETVFFEL